MPNLFTSGASLVSSIIGTHASGPVTYSRTGEDDLSLTMGKSNPVIEAVEPGSDYAALFRLTDWILPDASDFTYSTPPAEGDTIVHGLLTYEVIDIPGEGTYRYSDPGHTIMRIHTKEIRQ